MNKHRTTVKEQGGNGEELQSPTNSEEPDETQPFDLDDDVAQYCVPC
jgi:hypothetical protein